MINSNIQWTDHTWNIARGCTKVDEDCKYCYMYRDSLNNTRYNPLNVVRTKTVFNLPLRIKAPSKIFTSSLTDFFHEEIDSYRDEAWDIIRKCPHHTFQILTKRPERIADRLPKDWCGGWENVWLGASVGQPGGWERAVALAKIRKCKVHFLSCEPLTGPLDLRLPYKFWDEENTRCDHCCNGDRCDDRSHYYRPECPYCHGTGGMPFQWVIVGGESGNENGKFRYRECKVEWILDIMNQCKAAGVPVFVKQLGTHLAKQLKLKDRHGGDINEWPGELRVREMPKRKEVANG